MNSIFNPGDRESLARRLATLEAEAQRHWGTMDAAQMLKHCAVALEVAAGDRPMRQVFLGKLLTPFIRGMVLGEKPFRHNSPTNPSFIVSEAQDFEAERTRVATLIDRFVQRGPASAAQQVHPFFGRLSSDEWGQLVFKHLDHHLRQFGV